MMQETLRWWMRAAIETREKGSCLLLLPAVVIPRTPSSAETVCGASQPARHVKTSAEDRKQQKHILAMRRNQSKHYVYFA